MTLNKSTIRQTLYKDLYDVLNGNIGSYNSTSQPNVSRAFTDEAANLPEIVLHGILKGKTGFYIGETSTDADLMVRIDIFTAKNKKKDLDVLNDDIDVLIGDSLQGFDIDSWSESIAMETGNKNKLMMRTIAITFTYTN